MKKYIRYAAWAAFIIGALVGLANGGLIGMLVGLVVVIPIALVCAFIIVFGLSCLMGLLTLVCWLCGEEIWD